MRENLPRPDYRGLSHHGHADGPGMPARPGPGRRIAKRYTCVEGLGGGQAVSLLAHCCPTAGYFAGDLCKQVRNRRGEVERVLPSDYGGFADFDVSCDRVAFGVDEGTDRDVEPSACHCNTIDSL